MPYSDKVLDHYDNPRNLGSLDKNDPHVGTGIVGAPECGDVMKLQIKVNPLTGVIEDAKFKTFGCGSAIASSSLATEWMKGRTLDDAFAIKNDAIVEELSLPPVKVHCSVLAEDAIKAAVADLTLKQLPADIVSFYGNDVNRLRFLLVDLRKKHGTDVEATLRGVREDAEKLRAERAAASGNAGAAKAEPSLAGAAAGN
jgi:nitrogen fixation NifU-like protein